MEATDGFLAKDVVLNCPEQEPTLVIHAATFGHPGGAVRGRGSFDVRELLQVAL